MPSTAAPPPSIRTSRPPPLPVAHLELEEAELIAEPEPVEAVAPKSAEPAPPPPASLVPASAAVPVPPSVPVPPVAVSLPPVDDSAELDLLGGSPFRSKRSGWAMRAALTVLLIGAGFLAGRMTVSSPESASSAAAAQGAAAVEVTTQAAIATPTVPAAVAPPLPTAAPNPAPTDTPPAPTSSATAPPPSTHAEAPARPTATTHAAAPVVAATARSQPIDPLVQAVQQDIQQELDSRKKH